MQEFIGQKKVFLQGHINLQLVDKQLTQIFRMKWLINMILTNNILFK